MCACVRVHMYVSYLINDGKMIAPMPLPANDSPFAVARFLSKYWPTATIVGAYERPRPTPTQHMQ